MSASPAGEKQTDRLHRYKRVTAFALIFGALLSSLLAFGWFFSDFANLVSQVPQLHDRVAALGKEAGSATPLISDGELVSYGLKQQRFSSGILSLLLSILLILFGLHLLQDRPSQRKLYILGGSSLLVLVTLVGLANANLLIVVLLPVIAGLFLVTELDAPRADETLHTFVDGADGKPLHDPLDSDPEQLDSPSGEKEVSEATPEAELDTLILQRPDLGSSSQGSGEGSESPVPADESRADDQSPETEVSSQSDEDLGGDLEAASAVEPDATTPDIDDSLEDQRVADELAEQTLKELSEKEAELRRAVEGDLLPRDPGVEPLSPPAPDFIDNHEGAGPDDSQTLVTATQMLEAVPIVEPVRPEEKEKEKPEGLIGAEKMFKPRETSPEHEDKALKIAALIKAKAAQRKTAGQGEEKKSVTPPDDSLEFEMPEVDELAVTGLMERPSIFVDQNHDDWEDEDSIPSTGEVTQRATPVSTEPERQIRGTSPKKAAEADVDEREVSSQAEDDVLIAAEIVSEDLGEDRFDTLDFEVTRDEYDDAELEAFPNAEASPFTTQIFESAVDDETGMWEVDREALFGEAEKSQNHPPAKGKGTQASATTDEQKQQDAATEKPITEEVSSIHDLIEDDLLSETSMFYSPLNQDVGTRVVSEDKRPDKYHAENERKDPDAEQGDSFHDDEKKES